MACEMCQHCQNPLTQGQFTTHCGYSYHENCTKCYVCSETDLHDAETFMGVIFCGSCSNRIFQGCSTVRQNRTPRPIPFSNCPGLKSDQGMSSRVLELTQTLTDSSGSNDGRKGGSKRSFVVKKMEQKATITDNYTDMAKESVETGVTTYITQVLLKNIKDSMDYKSNGSKTFTKHPVSTKTHRLRPQNECSDLRIAELGASTEIANMALRKRSEVPVIIKSEENLKQSTSKTSTISETDEPETSYETSYSWRESDLTTIKESNSALKFNKKIGRVFKSPFRTFKKKILKRSSLVKVLNDRRRDSKSVSDRIHSVFYSEAETHQRIGIKRLYPTINRHGKPYKLGWMRLKSKTSCCIRSGDCEMHPVRCRHFRRSHNYRCMRNKVMMLAGPTKSELALLRTKIQGVLLLQALREMIFFNWNDRALMMSAACGSSHAP